jgi:hypothetical protein
MHEERFNRWYGEEPFPERVRWPEFRSARRFVGVAGEPKYQAFQELDDPEVLDMRSYQPIQPLKRMDEEALLPFHGGGSQHVPEPHPAILDRYEVYATCPEEG